MIDNVKIARKLGYLNIADDLLVPIDQALNMQDHKVVLMCTGSQGEPSSIVGRLSTGTNRQFDLKPGDTVVLSSHPIPGNEETISKTINRLLRRGAMVIYDGIAAGARLRTCQPGRTEAADQPGASPSTSCRSTASCASLPGMPSWPSRWAWRRKTSSWLRTDRSSSSPAAKLGLGERIPGDYVFVDGESIGDIDHGVMREREMLARNGILLIDISLDKLTGASCTSPRSSHAASSSPEDAERLIPEVRKRVMEVVNGGGLENEKDIVSAVKAYLHEVTKRRPMVFVTLSRS